jgi:hypothetical protein
MSPAFPRLLKRTVRSSGEVKAGAFVAKVELSVQATVNLTQTMSKTGARSKGFQLNVDLGGVECKGITDYNDRPVLPGKGGSSPVHEFLLCEFLGWMVFARIKS